MKIKTRPSSGFTLIELLVVISIIAILASLAIPAVTGALTRGQLLQTLNNARQLQIATQTMSLDTFTTGEGLSWTTGEDGTSPVDLTTYFTRLTQDNYLTEADLRKLLSAPGIVIPATGLPAPGNVAFRFFQVGENSPGDHPFVITRNWEGNALTGDNPYGTKGFVLFRKGGEGNFFTRPTDAERVFTTEMTGEEYNQDPIN